MTNTLPAIEGQALANHTVGSLRVTGQDVCEIKCFLHGLCVSYNLGPQENSGHVCELSDPDHFRDPQDLKTRHGFFYVAFEVRGHRLNHELHRVFSSFSVERLFMLCVRDRVTV